MVKKKKVRGVPVGYVHDWTYSKGQWVEKKTGPKTWRFVYKNSKVNRKLKSYKSGPGKGSEIVWKIDANQYAKKVAPWKYDLLMIGKKKLVGKMIKKRRNVKNASSKSGKKKS